MILNGHHRWTAALRVGLKAIPINIINLTSETDIENMILASQHEKRVTMDLDEVIFCDSDQIPAERSLPFPARTVYKERTRLGIPSLLHALSKHSETLHIDKHAVLRTFRDTKEFTDIEIKEEGSGWSHAVLEIIKELNADGQK